MMRSSFSMRARFSACTLVAVSAVALAACGSSSSKGSAAGAGATSSGATNASAAPSSDSSGGSSGGSSQALCKMFTAEDAAKLFGKTATSVSDSTPSALAKEQCVYKDKDRTANTAYWL